MKISHLSQSLSTSESLVFVPEKPIDDCLWPVFHQIYRARLDSGGIQLTRENGNIHVHTSLLPSRFDDRLEQILTDAESAIQGGDSPFQERLETDTKLKDEILRRAADVVRVPIRD